MKIIIMKKNSIAAFSLPLVTLLIIGSCVGIFTPDFYSGETPGWQAQSIGQDIINLFLVTPCLIVSSFLAYKNNQTAIKIWAGILLYLIYTFALYCFDLHFNNLFLLYCFCLGLSFYSFAYYFTKNLIDYKEGFINTTYSRIVGIYFIIVATAFYLLWLVEIIPAIKMNITPKTVVDIGLPTNGVHVLDLSIILPAIFLTGIYILKRKHPGFILAPVILTFITLMDISIGILAVVMKVKGIESSLMLTLIMAVLASFSLILLIGYVKNIRSTENSESCG